MSFPVVLALLAAIVAARAETASIGRLARQDCALVLHRDDAGLPMNSRRTRALLIADPGRVAAVVAEAGRAGQPKRAEMELGLMRAVDRLACLDPSGYRALADYLALHGSDPVVADLGQALNAQAAASATEPGHTAAASETYASSPVRDVGEAAVPAFVVSPNR